MISLKWLLEAVPFQKADVVSQRLQTSRIPIVSPETFGIELEFRPRSEDVSIADYEEEIVSSMTSAYNWRQNSQAYREWLDGKREYLNRHYGSYRSREWDDSYGPIDPDTWYLHHQEPERKDYDGTGDSEEDDTLAFEKDHDEWRDESKEVEYDYNQWERRGWDDHADEWARQMFNDGEWQNYTDFLPDSSDMSSEINNAYEFIYQEIRDPVAGENATQNHWGVGEDGDNVEIRSKHLKESEFNKVRAILRYVRTKETSGSTSAHVHVGLPDKFDAFDILSMSDLVDEPSILKAIGDDRDYNAWAKLNEDLSKDIIKSLNSFFEKAKSSETMSPIHKTVQLIETGWMMSVDTLESILKGKMDRYRGTNLAAFWEHRTIEFRYWSSEAAARDPENFIKWIRYFLLLPKVAHKRNKITIGIGGEETFVFSRYGPSHVKIEFEEKFKEAVLKNYQRRLRDKFQLKFPFAS